MENYEKVYQEFWKSIVEDSDGNIDLEQIKKELADYRDLMREVTKVYSELTNFSKPFTRAEYIINAVNDRMIDKQMAYDDLTMMAENGKVTLTVERLKGYFDIH